MEPLFTVSTNYTYEKYAAYSKALANKVNHLYLRGLLMTICLFAGAALEYFGENQTLCYTFLLAGILFPIGLYFGQKRATKKMWDSNKGAQNITANYSFYEDYFEQHNVLGDSRFTYQNLYRIIEVKDAFYLLVSRGQGIILDKADCDERACSFLRSIKTGGSSKK